MIRSDHFDSRVPSLRATVMAFVSLPFCLSMASVINCAVCGLHMGIMLMLGTLWWMAKARSLVPATIDVVK